MDARVANLFLFVHHVVKRLLKKFLLVALCLLLLAYLIFSLAARFRRNADEKLDVGHEAAIGRGRASTTLLKSNKFGSAKSETFLLLCILSAPANVLVRRAARETWMSLNKEGPNGGIVPLFVLGGEGLDADSSQALTHEMGTHHDLLILDDLVDSYANLTLKILHAYSWIGRHAKPRYVLKMDDDSFARVDIIREELKSLSRYDRLYWGFFDGRARPFKKGKWSEKSWNLCDLYIPYALGGGYVVSGNLVDYVARNAPDLRLFFNEDVAVGTWLAPLDVFRKHDARFDTEYKSRGCFSSYLVTHKQTVEMLRIKYDNLLRTGSICGGASFEFRSRMSYDYNWTVPPSQCCHRGKNNLP